MADDTFERKRTQKFQRITRSEERQPAGGGPTAAADPAEPPSTGEDDLDTRKTGIFRRPAPPPKNPE